MGLFSSSKSSSSNETNIDSRASQAGRDVNQINGNGNHITTTDHDAVAGALDFADRAMDSALGTVGDANRRVIDFADRSSVRNTEFADTLTRRVIDANASGNKAALDFADTQSRRANDTVLGAMSTMASSVATAFGFGDTQSRRLSDTANNAINNMTTVNRQALDANERAFENSLNFASANTNAVLDLISQSERRTDDLARSVIDTVTESNAATVNSAQNFANTQVNTIKDIAKSVTVGNEEGSNRLLLALIIGVVIIAIVIGVTVAFRR